MAEVERQDTDTFDDSPAGLAKRWQFELTAARKSVEDWHKDGEAVVKRFLDKRDDNDTGSRVNLFHSNTQTLLSMLYGKPPSCVVSRRFADADDDVARVAGEVLERHLNTDMEADGDGYTLALQYALQDRLIPGFGLVRVRYEAEFEDVGETPAKVDEDGNELAPAVPATQKKLTEDVDFDYVHWRDCLWSPARTWHEVRWVAFAAQMSRADLIERFGEEIGKAVPLQSSKKDDDEKTDAADPWSRACVWEIWCEESEKVYWYCEGYPNILDVKDDPLGLEGFFPCPRPMIANLTTSELMPRPDFVLAQDLYDEVDLVRTRITLLERAIRVTGVYDKANGSVRRLLEESGENELYPVDNWAMFAEKGGLRGAVDYLPLEQIVAALTALRDYSSELMDLLYQVTGMADIMRGQATVAGSSATEQAIKAKFGSVRVQAMQDDFARFASEALSLKAEIISKHFDVATIIKGANIQRTSPDAALMAPALELIKSEDMPFRVEVKPEAVSLTDFGALKSERMELLMGLSNFMQATAPLAQSMPSATPFLLRMLQWAIAGFKGSSEIEGVMDGAIASAEKAAQQPQQAAPPDPKLMSQQLKGQQDLAKVQAELQADLMRTQAEVQADAQREENQARWNVREASAKQQVMNASRLQRVPPKGFGG